MERFWKVFDTSQRPLPALKGKPHHIHWTGGKPVAYHSPTPIAVHWKKQVRQKLENDVKQGIIEPVPVGGKVTHCARMLAVKKKDGSPYFSTFLHILLICLVPASYGGAVHTLSTIVIDYTHLNK